MSRDGFVALPCGAIGLSAVCNCGITRSYSLTISVTCHFMHICTRAMALDLRQNFVSTQYLENKILEFHQILYMNSY